MSFQTTLPAQSVSPSVSAPTAEKSGKRRFFSFFSSSRNSESSHFGSSSSVASSRFKRNFKKNKFFFIPLLIIIVLVIAGVVTLVRSTSNNTVASVAGSSDTRVELKQARAQQVLNKTFSFPLLDEKGKEVSKIKFTLENAELRDEIIVKGQKATSVKGREFLILTVKIQNDYSAPVQINARDYVRVIIDGKNDEKLAPDIHNDPVEVQAISTKQTRLGLPIDDTAKKIVLQIGEINGKKEEITLDFKK